MLLKCLVVFLTSEYGKKAQKNVYIKQIIVLITQVLKQVLANSNLLAHDMYLSIILTENS